jgi:hypothetical protein
MALGMNGRAGDRFALLRYRRTGNLGDEIQSLAARRFLPRVDALLDRDALNRRPRIVSGPIKLILHGWFTHRPDAWPPHPAIVPLIVSVHLSDFVRRGGFSAAEAWVVGANAKYLRARAPIGARDLWTLDLLQRNGIDSYFSGCLSLTMSRPEVVTPNDYIVLNDLDASVADAAHGRTRLRVVRTTHEDTSTSGFSARMQKTDALLRLYAGARSVLTSRLHCALPCLAMGTPVLFVARDANINRLHGLIDLSNHCTPAQFLAGSAEFDLDDPPTNPNRHLALRRALESRCAAFIARHCN